MALFMVDIETATTRERYDEYVKRERSWRLTLKPSKNAEERARVLMDTGPRMPHGDDPKRDKIVSIQFQKLSDLQEGEVAPLIRLREWEHPGGEGGILRDFAKATGYYSKKWDCVKVGWNLRFEDEWLRHKGVAHGLIPWGKAADFERPCIDLQHIGYLMNADARRPAGEMGNVPNMFYGASLSRFSRKRGAGSYITELYHERRFAAIDDYTLQESKAFVELWETLVREAPKWWQTVIAPRVGR